MKETDLAKAIDKAAEQRGQDIMDDIVRSIRASMDKKWRSTKAGEHFIGTEIRDVLVALSTSDNWLTCRVKPSADLVMACRGAIVNELLTGLPKIAELTALAQQYVQESEPE